MFHNLLRLNPKNTLIMKGRVYHSIISGHLSPGDSSTGLPRLLVVPEHAMVKVESPSCLFLLCSSTNVPQAAVLLNKTSCFLNEWGQKNNCNFNPH